MQGHEASGEVIVAHSGCGGVLWLPLPAAAPSLRLSRAPGQGCRGAWDAARASCLRRGEEQTDLQMQGLQSANLVYDPSVLRSPKFAQLYNVLVKLEIYFFATKGRKNVVFFPNLPHPVSRFDLFFRKQS